MNERQHEEKNEKRLMGKMVVLIVGGTQKEHFVPVNIK